jgi:drug/metabolite transporter (DMT)-like permease
VTGTSEARELAPQGLKKAAALRPWVGVLAALATVTIWASWLVATRQGTRQIDLNTILLLRFLIPAVIFMPVLWRIGLVPKGVPKVPLIMMVVGSGLPGFLLAAVALRFAPAAEVAPLMPGTLPLWVAAMAVVWDKQRLEWRRLLGFMLIAASIVCIAGVHILAEGRVALGHVLAVATGFCWGMFAFAFQKSGLTAIQGAALVNGWSALAAVPFGVMPLMAALGAGQGGDILIQALMQGIASGVLALVLFGVAVSALGAPNASAFHALIPALAALFAIPLLGELPRATDVAGIVAVSVGVLLVNWPQRAVAGR